MPRNGSGTYTLSDTIANATTADASELQAILNDIATALTGSLAANGETGITAQMLGLVSTNPAWSFVGDTNTGFGSDSADEAWIKAGGTKTVTVTATGTTVTGTANVTGVATLASASVTGAATVGNSLTVTTGGISVLAGGLGVVGNSSITGSLNVSSLASAGAVTGTAITASGALSGATAAGTMVATQADQETGTSTTTLVSPGRQHFHQGAAKAWGKFAGASGTSSATYNSSTAKDSAGNFTVTITNAMSSANYAIMVTPLHAADVGFFTRVRTQAAGSFTIEFRDLTNANSIDPDQVMYVCYGDL